MIHRFSFTCRPTRASVIAVCSCWAALVIALCTNGVGVAEEPPKSPAAPQVDEGAATATHVE
ncbi:MAG: hypothetical protein D6741_12590, partial [Planctomycetota bacterium]